VLGGDGKMLLQELLIRIIGRVVSARLKYCKIAGDRGDLNNGKAREKELGGCNIGKLAL
jgi:hypothetical protein